MFVEPKVEQIRHRRPTRAFEVARFTALERTPSSIPKRLKALGSQYAVCS